MKDFKHFFSKWEQTTSKSTAIQWFRHNSFQDFQSRDKAFKQTTSKSTAIQWF